MQQEVSRESGPRGLAIAGLLWLGLFSLFFSIGAALDLWPTAPEGRFGRLDLAVGIVFGVVLLLQLLRESRS
jgi:hypothetical protein